MVTLRSRATDQKVRGSDPFGRAASYWLSSGGEPASVGGGELVIAASTELEDGDGDLAAAGEAGVSVPAGQVDPSDLGPGSGLSGNLCKWLGVTSTA